MPLSPGQLLKDRYRIGKLLGQGGFGAVYRAWDVTFDTACAIKENVVISEAAQRQFLREARLLHELRHPNLPQVTDYFVLPGQGQYLVMDFIEGEDLCQRLETSSAPLPVAQTLDWIGQVCRALEYLHSQSPPVIHRDIKPANIRITPAGRAMLVDFGIAKRYDAALPTTTGARAVTPGYSPPEQYGEAPTDVRSDIYALGATLYHLLCGRRPPDSLSLMVRSALLQPLGAVNPAVPAPVSAAVGRAMQLDATQRFASVGEFAAALGLTPGAGAPQPPLVQVQPAPHPARAPYQPAPAAPPTQRVASKPVTPAAPQHSRRLPCAAVALGVLLVGGVLVGCLWLLGMMLQQSPAPPVAAQQATASQVSKSVQATAEAVLKASALPGSPPTARASSGADPALAAFQTATAFPPVTIEPTTGLPLRFLDEHAVVMALAPPGAFQMGVTAQSALAECQKVRSDCQLDWFKPYEPVHTVQLGAFYIDQTEVTNAQYARCVQAGACSAPWKSSSETRQNYYGAAEFDDYPVVWVDWAQADAFCRWRGGRLPSEAEWEKAARGGQAGRLYPWGDALPDCSQANFNNCVGDTTKAGSYPPTGYGLYDMGGNAWEWAADWYSSGYYAGSPAENPAGPLSGKDRVARAGSYNNPAFNLMNAFRFAYPAAAKGPYIGFRCARTP